MEKGKEERRRLRVGRMLAIAVGLGLGVVGEAAIQVLLIRPFIDVSARPIIDQSRVKAGASDLIATAHDWADAADRRRAALEDAQAARQARIDRAAQDLLDHD